MIVLKRILPCAVALAMTLSLAGCQNSAPSASSADQQDTTQITLSDQEILVNGEAASTDKTAAVYTAHDIVFYLEGQDLAYGEGTPEDAHPQSEADAHTVVHIAQPGVYRLSGTLSQGQVAIDLGKDADEDPNASVTLILDGVDITCTVAPGVIFYNVYECGSTDAEQASREVDTSAAGAKVIIADDSVNSVNGSYVARIYKPETVELSEDGSEVVSAKKLHKYDGAFYSKMSMDISGGEQGTGVLNIHADNEGLDSELHLTLNSGHINITAGNDGINTNEDNVSVTTINGGTLNILVDGATGEGDGIDSNGWLVINGGTVTTYACSSSPDSGLDSDMGIHINGGTVVSTGNMFDQIDESTQNYVVFSFAQPQEGDTTYALKNADGKVVAECTPANHFTYLVLSNEALEPGVYTLWQGEQQLAASSGSMMGFPGGGQPPEMPMDGQEPPALPEGMQPGQHPERPEQPEGARPEPPKDMQPGQHPEMPDGQRPEGGMPHMGMGSRTDMQPPEDLSVEFSLTEGGTFFTFVSPAE